MKAACPTVKLGDVMSLTDTSVSTAELGEVNLAGVYSFGRGLFMRGPMNPADTSYKRYNRLVAGDFVMSQPKAWEGALTLVTQDFDGWFLSPVFSTFRTHYTKLDPHYLDWFCKQAVVWQSLQQKSRGLGARRETVSPEQFLTLEIPLPPVAEQRRIVARIEELAAQIAEARALREQAAEQQETLVISTHLKLAGSRTRVLGDILHLDEDKTPVAPDGSYPQVGVRSFGGGLFPKSAVSGNETTYKAFNRLYEGALLLSQVKGWEGAVAVCPKALAGWFVSPEYRTFRCVPSEVRPGYMAALIRTEWFWGRLAKATRGVGARRERTRPEQFLSIEIPMPSVEQQAVAEQVFAGLDAIKDLRTETSVALDALMPAILDRAFKGDL